MRNPIAALRGRKGPAGPAGDPPPRDDEPQHAPPQDAAAVTLTIVALDLTGAGPADQTRLQLKVNVRHRDAPTMIRSWRLSAHIAGRYETGHHIVGRNPARALPATARAGGAAFPLSDERVTSLQFVIPAVSRREFLDNLAGSELVLTATDELGAQWSTRLDLIAVGQAPT